MKFVKASGKRLATVFQNLDNTKIRKGVVHLDMWYDNMNIDKDGKITVFDFDFCGNGRLVLDIAYFVLQLFNTEPDKEKYEAKLASFYSGYEIVLPLRKEEKELLFILTFITNMLLTKTNKTINNKLTYIELID